MPKLSPDSWESPQKILVILAHPDDPEFFCGATLARWAQAGHEITYCLLTCGDKGSSDPNISTDELCQRRHKEQKNAAKIIGVKEVHFLDRPDGYLVPDMETRRMVTRAIRQFTPDILVTCDPTNLYPSEIYPLNHPDHRAAGQVVLDAVFPAAGSHLFFPALLKEGFAPHRPDEVWISLTRQANTVVDVTDTWETKMQAILEHKSQVKDPSALIERMHKRGAVKDSPKENPCYEEHFRVIRLRR
ncbi:MAG: PIG-L family deacetylase [Anaerolineae bacterium]|nr:PIG-L family deacetylase [Anaerolineae bacterium]